VPSVAPKVSLKLGWVPFSPNGSATVIVAGPASPPLLLEVAASTVAETLGVIDPALHDMALSPMGQSYSFRSP
jgi:hypothetical protein